MKIRHVTLLLACFFVPAWAGLTEGEVESFSQGLQSPQAKVRVRAADRVQQLDEIPPALVPVLFGMVMNVRRTGDPIEDLTSWTAVHFADLALAKCGKRVVPQLREYTKNPTTRWTAVGILNRIGAEAVEAVPELILALQDKNENVRPLAARTLLKLGPAAAPAVDALIVMLRDPKEELRETAVEALGQVGPPAAKALPALRKLLKSDDLMVPTYAKEAIAKIEQPK